MDNANALKQLRDANKAHIDASPSFLTGNRVAYVDDGFGGQMPDPSGAAVPFSCRARVSHERAQVPEVGSNPVGLDTNLSYYVTMRHNDYLREHDTVTYNGKQYRVGRLDPKIKFGGVVSYHAVLYPAVSTIAEGGT